MDKWKRREVLKLGVFGSTAAVAPRWVLASAVERSGRNLALNRAAWASSSADFINTGHMSTDGQASTRWQSSDADAQWLYVDLGAVCKVRSVVLSWGTNYALAYQLQVSTDCGPSAETGLVENWLEVQQMRDGKGGVEEIDLPGTEMRYVRILLTEKAKPGGYELTALEVYGEGGCEAAPSASPPEEDGTLRLSGGWRLVNQAAIADKAATVSRCGYDDRKWLVATLPGTVLTSYLNVGAIPDPFYGGDRVQISDFFAHTNWWYRNEVELPSSYAGHRVWLHFDGINYRASVYVNGVSAGSIDGAFIRGRFDVTEMMMAGRKNCIAVLIMPVPKPDKVMPKRLSGYEWPAEFPENEPTILAADSWDWLPTIADRDTGIWNHVRLTKSGDVTIENPFASTHFPDAKDQGRADITLKVELKNHSSQAYKGELKVRLGEVEFTHQMALEGGETRALTFDKSTQPTLSLVYPKLWWPNGYGEQNLYDLTLEFKCDGKVSDVSKSRIGIREFTFNHKSLTEWDTNALRNGMSIAESEVMAVRDPLTFFCNGQRIFVRGVNWGMEEGMLRCDRTGFERRVRMEKEMNFNLIRNWAGNLDKPEFFDICDEYGLMVWEEFGLANQLMPDDPGIWLTNARDRFLRRRNHACVVVWCAANESLPEDPILTEMPRMAEELDGTRLFLHSSIQVPPTEGDGPYDTRPASFYFKELARGFRPELGSPAVPPVESMRRMMPHNKLWPVNEMWAMHDWWLGNGWDTGTGMCGSTQTAIAGYGAPKGVEDFCSKAQMVNMEVFKAIYEAWNDRMWNDCTGVMVWMSNPAWPSLTWNLYDYYGEANAGYFACRKACEPIHIQWNVVTNKVKVINCSFSEVKGLSAEAAIYNMGGTLVHTNSVHLDCPANSTNDCMTLFVAGEDKTDPLSSVHFIKLALRNAAGKLLSTNFYWRGKEDWKYEDLEHMPQVNVTGAASAVKDGYLTVDLENPTQGVALMVRLKLVDRTTGQLLAPVLYSDNYVSLTAQEHIQIDIDLSRIKPGRIAKLVVIGWNVPPIELAESLSL